MYRNCMLIAMKACYYNIWQNTNGGCQFLAYYLEFQLLLVARVLGMYPILTSNLGNFTTLPVLDCKGQKPTSRP